ncbi:MAG TPA: serine hydrolase domain-containing protein [Jatrophihabitans sp.]|jgi:CubicO group peptidase (beta-lactamase class C family)
MAGNPVNPLDQIARWPVPNAAAAVLSDAGLLATAGDPLRPFPLASVTKPLTSLATLVAVEEGALELDDPIGDQALAAELPGATLRHLLAHASGIGPDSRQRAAEPGTRRIYSNAGFDLIGEMVSEATEMPFADYLQQAVFAPLGMSTAVLGGSPASQGVASINDLIAVVSELLAPTGFLHPSTLNAARTVQFADLPGVLPGYGAQQHNDWGLGFEIRADKSPHWTSSRNSPATYGHFGGSGTMMWIDPEAQLALVALADRDFDEWAIKAWPVLSEAVLAAYA